MSILKKIFTYIKLAMYMFILKGKEDKYKKNFTDMKLDMYMFILKGKEDKYKKIFKNQLKKYKKTSILLKSLDNIKNGLIYINKLFYYNKNKSCVHQSLLLNEKKLCKELYNLNLQKVNSTRIKRNIQIKIGRYIEKKYPINKININEKYINEVLNKPIPIYTNDFMKNAIENYEGQKYKIKIFSCKPSKKEAQFEERLALIFPLILKVSRNSKDNINLKEGIRLYLFEKIQLYNIVLKISLK